MFRSNFQLTAGMFPYQFPKKSVIWVGKQIIKSDTGTDKDFLHLGQLSQLPENVQIFRMVGVNCRTNLRSKAFLALAKPFCQLLFAGWSTEVCRRPTNIVNISLKVGHFCNLLCFF